MKTNLRPISKRPKLNNATIRCIDDLARLPADEPRDRRALAPHCRDGIEIAYAVYMLSAWRRLFYRGGGE